jgi:DNA-binding transcriptional LysR family regulator
VSLDTRISLRKLEVFSVVVQLGGVGRAAEQLYVAQPVVTAHIHSLEQRLGVKLFYREGRRLHLTEAGVAVHGWTEDLLTRTRELERDLGALSDGSQGTVAFGASMSLGSYTLPAVMTRFRERHPRAELRLSISDTEHAIEDTRAGILDFAVIVSEAGLELPGMVAEQVGSDEIVFVTAPDAGPAGDTLTPEELGRLPFIEAPVGIIRRTFIDRQLRRLGITDRDIVLELGHPEAMKRATATGLGVTLLFRSAVAEELADGSLREIHVEGADVTVPVYIVHRRGKSFSALHEGMIREIRAELAMPVASEVANVCADR